VRGGRGATMSLTAAVALRSLVSPCRPEAVLRCQRRHWRLTATTMQSPKRRAAPHARVLQGKPRGKATSAADCRSRPGRLARDDATSAADCRSRPGRLARDATSAGDCRSRPGARGGSRVMPRQLQTADLGRGGSRVMPRELQTAGLSGSRVRHPPLRRRRRCVRAS
jgi:hypothetical protein